MVGRFRTQRLFLKPVTAIHVGDEDVFDRILRTTDPPQIGHENLRPCGINRFERSRRLNRRSESRSLLGGNGWGSNVSGRNWLARSLVHFGPRSTATKD